MIWTKQELLEKLLYLMDGETVDYARAIHDVIELIESPRLHSTSNWYCEHGHTKEAHPECWRRYVAKQRGEARIDAYLEAH